MAKRTYLQRTIVTGEIIEFPFMPNDYLNAGVLPSTAAGMPILEAYQLVNRWNVSQADQQFVYALPQ